MVGRIAFHDVYRTLLRDGVLWAFLFGMFSSLMLDMGEAETIWEGTSITYGGMLLLVMIRRSRNPTPTDLIVLKWGFPVLYLVGFLVYPYVWRLRGPR